MKKIESVSEIAESVLKDVGLGKAVELWSIYKIFKDIFAKEISDNIRILGLSNGILRVKVPSSVWVQELSFFEKEVVDKINEFSQKKLVEQIKFTEV